ncbi:MAG TPA: hypothetical protein VNM67_22485 [Thermoanaerobaculia bacterium]|jgi:hypothetical protein|nr:hypothetical protein [Thermoanaerobaculia bacterium]
MLLLFALGLAGRVAAQVECLGTDTPEECWTREFREAGVSKAIVDEEEKEATKDEAEDLKDEPTGVQTVGANLASNTTDFLPLLALTGLLGDVQEGDTVGTYALDLNFLIPGFTKDHNSKLQAIVNSQPAVADGIKSQLPEDERDDLVGRIEEGLGDLSDYAVSYTFNWMDGRHGRGFEQYRNRVSALISSVSARFEVPEEGFTRMVLEFVTAHPDSGFSKTFDEMGADGATLKAMLEKAITQEIELIGGYREALAAAGIDDVGDLIDNQPQLTFSALKRFRDPVVGSDEIAVKVTYEWGSTNFNSVMSSGCHKTLDGTSPDLAVRSDCLAEFTRNVAASRTDIDRGQKLSFSAEYVDVGEEKFDLPNLGVTGLTLKGAKKLIVLGGWSRQFAQRGSDVEPMRLDFVARYEDVSDDPLRRDRGVATLTVTRQFGDLAIPFGIVYANHGEYLGEVDEQLSAHLGIKFDLEGGGD